MNSLLETLSGHPDYDPESLSVTRAGELILSLLEPVAGSERAFIRLGLNRVLSEDVVAPVDVPAHDNSAMDGYAMRYADLAASAGQATRLAIAGTAYAGRAHAAPVPPGQALRIMTGAIVPAELDTVVPQEAVQADAAAVIVPPGQRQGQHLRRAGEDLRAGQVALAAGKYLRPAEIGLLASLGIVEVRLRRRLRVAMLSTGDELCSLGKPLAAGEVYDSNRYTLSAMLARLGCEVIDMGVVRDEPQALEAALREAAACADAIVTSGGVSAGEADFVRGLMAKLGEVAFWKIAMKPGRPMAFGKIGDAWLFGLPGNPVAVMVSFYQFVRPALLRLMGAAPAPLPLFRVPCASAIRKAPGRTEYLRGQLFEDNGSWCVRPTGAQGSGILRSMADANCFIVLEHPRGSIAAGEMVSVQAMDALV